MTNPIDLAQIAEASMKWLTGKIVREIPALIPEPYEKIISRPNSTLHRGSVEVRVCNGYEIFKTEFLEAVDAILQELKTTTPTYFHIEFHCQRDSDCNIFPGTRGWFKWVLAPK
jgi:hypothetical protein